MISLDKFVVPVNGCGNSESLNVGEEKPRGSLKLVIVDDGSHLLKENDQNVGNRTLDDRNVEGVLINKGCEQDVDGSVRQLEKVLADLDEKVSDVNEKFCRICDGISEVDGKVDRLTKKLEQVSINARNAGD